LDRGAILDDQPVLHRGEILDDQPVLDKGVGFEGEHVRLHHDAVLVGVCREHLDAGFKGVLYGPPEIHAGGPYLLMGI
jgi:hypothetical protein